MPIFEIRAIKYHHMVRGSHNVPRKMLIDSDEVVYICPVDESMRLANMAPITARTAIFFTEQNGDYHCIYLQCDWLRTPINLNSSTRPEAQLIRICRERGRVNKEVMTPERLRQQRIFLAKETVVSQKVLIPRVQPI